MVKYFLSSEILSQSDRSYIVRLTWTLLHKRPALVLIQGLIIFGDGRYECCNLIGKDKKVYQLQELPPAFAKRYKEEIEKLVRTLKG